MLRQSGLDAPALTAIQRASVIPRSAPATLSEGKCTPATVRFTAIRAAIRNNWLSGEISAA